MKHHLCYLAFIATCAGAGGSFTGEPPVMVYAESTGVYYGKPVSVKDLLFDGTVKPSPVSAELTGKLDRIAAGR